MGTAYTVVRNFAKNKFKLLGAGYYAAVFESSVDPNLVYKIGRTINDPFITYATSTEYSNNIHFPKIYDIYFDIEDDWYIAKMEALTPLPEHKYSLAKAIEKFAKGEAEGSELSCDLRKLLSGVSKLSEACEFAIDLHRNNIMTRGTTIVVTDPLAGYDLFTESDMQTWIEGKDYGK